MNPWVYLYVFIALLMLSLLFHLVWRNWEYLDHYRVTRILSALLIPGGIIFSSWLLVEASHLVQDTPTWLPLIISQVISVSLLGIFTWLFIMLLIYVGKNWVMRRRHTFNRYFGPYLAFGEDPTTEMIIIWGRPLLGKPSSDTVLYGIDKTDLQPASRVIQATPMTYYSKLDNLLPGKQYFYKIPNKDATYHFTTAPKLEESNESSHKFEFAAVSDMHGSGKDISQTVKTIQKHIPNAAFIVSGGDNVSDGRIRAHWRTFWGQMAPISSSVPFHSCPGNHDGELRKTAIKWQNIFPHDYANPENGNYYKVIYGNVAVFIVDLYNNGKGPLQPNAEQQAWLKSEMQQLTPAIQHRLLVFHNALYTTGDFGCDPHLREIFEPLITEFGINVIVNGHSHIFEAFYRPNEDEKVAEAERKGTLFLVTGGGGARYDYCVTRSWSSTPYRWKSMTHIVKNEPYFGGLPEDPFRNDKFVLDYQILGKLTHQIMKFSVDGNKLRVQAIEWDGNILFEKTILGIGE